MQAHPILDLHMHSAISDGTDSPEALRDAVRAAGIDVFSVTDHDAIGGCERVRALLNPGDPAFVFGVEFSCRDALGKYHILGYGYDPQSPSIRDVVEVGHANRMKKLDLRLALLKDRFGISFPDADVAALHAHSNPGKPHLANLMVRYGFASSIRQAFADVLNSLEVPDIYLLPEEAIRSIRGAGGIPVLAHPCYGDGDQLIIGEALAARIRRLMGFGLMGLECFYSGFTPTLRAEALALAEENGLYVTAGSDYHGTNKLIRLADTGLSTASALPDGLVRFLRDVKTDA